MHSGYFHDLQHALSWRWTGDARAMRSSCLMSEHQTSWWVRHWSLDWSRITGQLRPYLDRSFRSLGSSVLCMVAVDVGDTWKPHVTFKCLRGLFWVFEFFWGISKGWRLKGYALICQWVAETFLTWPDLQRCFSWRFCMGSSGGGAKYGVQSPKLP